MTVQARGQYNNPVDYFARDAAAYETGFGDPAGEFWLGLDRLELLTRPGPVQLRVELETWQGHTVTALYKSFQVVGPDYRLLVATYSGDAGDALRSDLERNFLFPLIPLFKNIYSIRTFELKILMCCPTQTVFCFQQN